MPFCQNCGTKIERQSSICPSCGKFLEREEAAEARSPRELEREERMAAREARRLAVEEAREARRRDREEARELRRSGALESGPQASSVSSVDAPVAEEIPEKPGPWRAIQICLFEKFGTFRGRASRSEFWFFILFFMGTLFVLDSILKPIEEPDRPKLTASAESLTTDADEPVDEDALRDALANLTEEDLSAEPEDETLSILAGESTDEEPADVESDPTLVERICTWTRLIVFFALFTPWLAVSIRRFHDSEKSGALFTALNFGMAFGWGLLCLGALLGFGEDAVMSQVMGGLLALLGMVLAFAFFVVIFVFMCLDGTPRPNRYGLPPEWKPNANVAESNPFAVKTDADQSARSPLDNF